MLFFQTHVSSCQSTHCHAWHGGPDGAEAHSLHTFICANNTSRAEPQIVGVWPDLYEARPREVDGSGVEGWERKREKLSVIVYLKRSLGSHKHTQMHGTHPYTQTVFFIRVYSVVPGFREMKESILGG